MATDDLIPSDINSSSSGTPPDSTDNKPKRDLRAQHLAAAKRANQRLSRMLAGLKKYKQEALLKGPLALTKIQQLQSEFVTVCVTADTSLVGRKNKAAAATVTLRLGAEIVEAVQGFADVFYEYGTPGRSLFFAAAGKTSVADSLDACVRGLEADRTDTKDAAGKPVLAPHLIPVTPETDTETVKKAAIEVRAAQELLATETEGREAAATKRETLGAEIRKMTPRVEALVRRLNKHTPALLADYGVRPR